MGSPEWQREQYSIDPLGNIVTKLPISPGGDSPQSAPRLPLPLHSDRGSVASIVRQPSAREHEWNQPVDESLRLYDASGNQVRASQVVEAGSGGSRYVAWRQHSHSYFDGEERMRVFQEYDARYTQGSSWGTDHGVWEEYRYDPLGRRVMVTTRRESPLCTAPGSASVCGDASCGPGTRPCGS